MKFLFRCTLFLVCCMVGCKNNKGGETAVIQPKIVEGIYKGTYPSKESSGIEATLLLQKNGTFRYLLKDIGSQIQQIRTGDYLQENDTVSLLSGVDKVRFLLKNDCLELQGVKLSGKDTILKKYFILKRVEYCNMEFNGRYISEHAPYDTVIIHKTDSSKLYNVRFLQEKREKIPVQSIFRLVNDSLKMEGDEKLGCLIFQSHDGLGIEILPEDTHAKGMQGKYIKCEITQHSIGTLSDTTSIGEFLQGIPLAQVQKIHSQGEFADDVYTDYKIYTPDMKLLYIVTPKDSSSLSSKIERVMICSPLFYTSKRINLHSTFGGILSAYPECKVQPNENSVVVTANHIHADFSILKKWLQKGWWNQREKKVNMDKIPLNAPIEHFILWWNEDKTVANQNIESKR